jgi:hypothetical protein
LLSSTDLMDDGWEVDDMVVDRDVEALAIMWNSDAGGRVTTGYDWEEEVGLREKKPGRRVCVAAVPGSTILLFTVANYNTFYGPTWVEVRRK